MPLPLSHDDSNTQFRKFLKARVLGAILFFETH